MELSHEHRTAIIHAIRDFERDENITLQPFQRATLLNRIACNLSDDGDEDLRAMGMTIYEHEVR